MVDWRAEGNARRNGNKEKKKRARNEGQWLTLTGGSNTKRKQDAARSAVRRWESKGEETGDRPDSATEQ